MKLRCGYNAVDFSIDGGLFLGVIILLFSVYYYIQGYVQYTAYNFGISFVASTFQMLTSVVGLVCVVNGLGGPTSAILQTHSILGMILNAVFLHFIPTLS